MSKGEREITSKLKERSHKKGERILRGENVRNPRCLVFKRREVTCL